MVDIGSTHFAPSRLQLGRLRPHENRHPCNARPVEVTRGITVDCDKRQGHVHSTRQIKSPLRFVFRPTMRDGPRFSQICRKTALDTNGTSKASGLATPPGKGRYADGNFVLFWHRSAL